MNERGIGSGTDRTGRHRLPDAGAPEPSGSVPETDARARDAALYAFGEYELDALRFELRRRGVRVPVQPKPLALLLHLVARRERLVPREELVAQLWPDVVVSEDALFHALKMAREAVGDGGRRQQVIETVRGVGFRFVAPVEVRRIEPTRTAARTAPRPLGIPPLVGRGALLAALAAALDDAVASRRGRFVLLEGEAGIGKTRLLEAFAEAARSRGAQVALAACRQAGGPVLGPWSQLLEQLLAAASDASLAALAQGESGAWLGRIVPALHERLPAAARSEPLDAATDTESRWRLFGAVARLLGGLAESRGLVLLLDDLHWADVATLRLADHLLGELTTRPILIVGATRDERHAAPGALTELRGEAARLELGEVHRVERLGRVDVGALLDPLVGRPPSPALVDAVYERTDGNPFFVVQVGRELGTRVAASPDAGSEALAGVPPAVQQVVAGRLSRLGEPARELLALAAVAGGESELSLLQRAWPGAPDALLDGLEEARAARFLEDAPGGLGRVRFVHALIRDAVSAELPSVRRARLHRTLAETLEARLVHEAEAPGAASDADAPAAAIAHHYREAAPLGTSEAAARWSIRAGDAAMRRAAYEEAAAEYERGMALQDPARLEPRARFELLYALGRARHLGLGDYVRARESFLAASELAAKLGDPERQGEAALAYAAIPQSSAGAVEEPCLRVLEQALEAQPPGARSMRARILARLGAFLANEPRRQAEAVSLAERALAAAREAGDSRTRLEALLALQRALRLQGAASPERRLAVSDECEALAGEIGDPVLSAIVQGQRLAPLLELGRGPEADTVTDRFTELADATRVPVFAWLAPVLRASRAFLHGELGEVEETARSALPIAARVPGSVAPGVLAAVLHALRREQARLGELELPFRALVQQYEAVPGPRAWLAFLLVEAGKPEDAAREVVRLTERGLGAFVGTEGRRPSLALLAEACVALQDAEAGARLYTELAPAARHALVVGDGVLCLGPAARVLGRLAGLLRRWEEAEVHFQRALALCVSLASPVWDARTRLDRARVLLARGRAEDRDRARGLLREADVAARRFGLVRIAQEVAAPGA